MKNKKMVATLASLCLIVVAVVAAVVGVLAAVTQNVNGNFSVSYTARNVSATVRLKSKGPVYDNGDRAYTGSWDTVADHYETTFAPMAKTTTATLQADYYDFGWADDDALNSDFLGVAIYQFEFHNNYAAGGHNLTVLPSYTLPTDANLTVLKYTSTESGLGINDLDHKEWDESSGALSGSFDIKASVKVVSDVTKYTPWTSGTFTVQPAQSVYFYLIIALADASLDMINDGSAQLAEFTGSNISFVLSDTTTVVIPS